MGFLSYLGVDGNKVDTLISLLKCVLQSVNLSLVKENQLSAQESSLIVYLIDFENSGDDVGEHAASIEDELLCVVAGCFITIGPHSVLKVDDQNVIYVHRFVQNLVPLVKPEGKLPAYIPDQRYITLLG